MSDWLDELKKDTEEKKRHSEEKRIEIANQNEQKRWLISDAFEQLRKTFEQNLSLVNSKLYNNARVFRQDYPDSIINAGSYTISCKVFGCEISLDSPNNKILFDIKARGQDGRIFPIQTFEVTTDGNELFFEGNSRIEIIGLYRYVIEKLHKLAEGID